MSVIQCRAWGWIAAMALKKRQQTTVPPLLYLSVQSNMHNSREAPSCSLWGGLAATLTSNARPDRLLITLLLRRAANWVRSTAYFYLRCRYARRRGMVRIPWSVSIWAPNRIVEFGHCVQFGPRCVVQCDIRFGSHVLIAGDVAFVGRGDHRFDLVGTTVWNSPRGAAEMTVVEDDVWIGYGAIVLSGHTVGRGSVIAAGAVVTSNVERYSIVAGVPARETGRRFTAEEIRRHEELLSSPGYL